MGDIDPATAAAIAAGLHQLPERLVVDWNTPADDDEPSACQVPVDLVELREVLDWQQAAANAEAGL
jgi:hypothetical protein